MATYQTIDLCRKKIKEFGIKSPQGDHHASIDLAFFGIEYLIDQDELSALSVSEQRLHEREDEMLISVYADPKSLPRSFVIYRPFAAKNYTSIELKINNDRRKMRTRTEKLLSFLETKCDGKLDKSSDAFL